MSEHQKKPHLGDLVPMVGRLMSAVWEERAGKTQISRAWMSQRNWIRRIARGHPKPRSRSRIQRRLRRLGYLLGRSSAEIGRCGISMPYTERIIPLA